MALSSLNLRNTLLLLGAALLPSMPEDSPPASMPVRTCTSGVGPHVLWDVALGCGIIPGELTCTGGKVLVGASNDLPLDPALRGNHGILACFDAKTGRFLWQAAHPRLPSRVNDLPGSAIGSQPCVDGDRVYYVSNRGELVCLDLQGFMDGENDGEGGERRTGELCADFVWTIDMVQDLGVFKRDAADVGNPTSSPIVVGGLVYCVTGNGALYRDGKREPPHPDAPSLLAAEKATGRIVWSSNAPGNEIVYGQWSSPAHARVAGVAQVIFPGGDGRLRGFEASLGKLLWTVDLNGFSPPQRSPEDIRPFPVSAPVMKEGVIYLGLRRDLEMLTVSPLLAIDAAAVQTEGEKPLRWTFQDEDFGSSVGSPAIAGDVVFAVGQEGTVFALDLATGRELWRAALEDERGAVASPIVDEGKVYVPGESRITVFRAGRKAERLGAYAFKEGYPGTPVITRGRLHVATTRRLWALRPWE